MNPRARLSWQDIPLTSRAYALRNFILPWYLQMFRRDTVEIIVAGEWEPPLADEYQYIEVPAKVYGIRDVIDQRQAAFEAARADILVYQTDDHMLDLTMENVPRIMEKHNADILVPQRRSRLHSNHSVELPNGLFGDGNGYIPFHAACYRRHVLEAVPWTSIEGNIALDVEHAVKLAQTGASAFWTNTIFVWDIEPLHDEWSVP